MAQVLADLVVRLDANAAQLRTEIEKAKDQLSGFAKSTSEATEIIKGLFEYEVIKEATAAFFEFVKGGAEAAEQLVILSQKVGVSVAEISRLSFAARMVGSDGQSMANSLGILSRNMEQAQAGTGKAAGAFQALGISVTDGSGHLRSSVDVMMDVAARFAVMENGAGKTALAMLMFGRSGADMVPLLNRGREGIQELMDESDRLGKTMGDEVARGAAAFNEEIKKLQGTGTIFAATIASALAPSMKQFNEVLAEGGPKTNAMATAADGLAISLKGLATAGLATYLVFEALGKTIAGWAAEAVDGAGAVIQAGAVVTLGMQGQWKAAGVAWGAAKNDYREMKAAQTAAAVDLDALFTKVGKYYDAIWNPPRRGAGPYDPLSSVNAPKMKAPLIPDAAEQKDQERALERLQKLADDWRQKAATMGLGGEKSTEEAKLRFRIDEGDLASVFATAGPKAEKFRDIILENARAFDQFNQALARGKEASNAIGAMESQLERLHSKLRTEEGTTEYDRQAAWLGLPQQQRAMSAMGPSAASRYQDDILQTARAIDDEAETNLKASLALKAHENAMREGQSILESMSGPLDRYRVELAKVNDAYLDGALSEAQADQARKRIEENFIKSGGVMNDFAKAYSADLKSILGENIFDGFKNGLAAMVSQFGQALMKMAAQAAASKIVDSIFNPSGGAGAGALNWIGGLFGSPGGGGVGEEVPIPYDPSILSGIGLAGGGSFGTNELHIVGENGPELMATGSVSGQVISNDRLASALRTPAPQQVTLQVHPDALHMTLRDWLEGELARQAAVR